MDAPIQSPPALPPALDPRRIRASLAPPVAGGLQDLRVADCVDSTNAVLLAGDIPASGTRVLLAESQSAGRGRLGRRWVSPPRAHLYLSLARRFDAALPALGGLSLVTGVAVAEALQAALDLDVALKWPNDLQFAGRKLGGILVEAGGRDVGGQALVVGVGVNVRMPDDMAADVGQPWIDLATALPEVALDRSQLVAALINGLLPAFDVFAREGLQPFLPRFDARDALRGLRIDVHAATGPRAATALGVADDGALRVRFDDGSESALHAGEVSIRTTP